MNSARIEDIYPLSPMQQGMLFHTLYEPGSGAYVEQLSCRLSGRLEVANFERAWQRVVERHAVLRSAFVWEDLNEPVQVVCRDARMDLEVHDWRGQSTGEQEAELSALLQDDCRRGFDLAQAPLMRLTLIRAEAETYRFVWSFHHILLDGWSAPLLFHELFAYYEAFGRGADIFLERPRPYKDYIAWLRRQDLSGAEQFWREALNGFKVPTALNLETSVGSTVATVDNDGEEAALLSGETTDSLQRLTRQHGLTMHTIIQGAWALLLSHYSGEQDLVFGTVIAGRPAELAGVEQMVGLFINTLPARVLVQPEAQALSWLRELQAQQVSARAYEYSPLVQVQGWSEAARGRPLFESLLVFENYPVEAALKQPGADIVISEARFIERTNYPLTVIAVPGPSLSLRIIYDRSRFDSTTITRLLGHLQTLLSGIATAPDRCLADICMLTQPEQQQLLGDWNDTRTEVLPQQCAQRMFEAQVARTPEAIAVVCGNEQLSYHELNGRANQLAHHLRGLGIGPDAVVGILLEHSVDQMVALLGVLKAGGAYLPLDPAYPEARLLFMLKDAGVSLLLTRRGLTEKVAEQAAPILLRNEWRSVAAGEENPESGVMSEHLAYVIYTSGSTGRPKGVAMPHSALANLLAWQLRNSTCGAGSRTLQYASLSFDVSFQEIFSTWGAGGTLVLITEELRREPAELLEFLETAGVNRLFLPYVALQQLAQSAPEKRPPSASLREIITAGEQLQITPQIRRFCERIPGCTLHNQYGPSESHVATAFTLKGPASQWPALPPIGRPIANAQVYILDPYLSLLPVGVPGSVYLGGSNLARGYLHRPELTAERFIPHPFSTEFGARLYRTGDRAKYRADGEIEFLGRMDLQVKVRGYRIEPGEVEATLSTHPAVSACAVAARSAEGDGAGDRRLVAYVVASSPEVTLNSTELRSFLQARLPEQMVPSVFVALDALPLTASGKVNRQALPAADVARPELAADFSAPRTPDEELLTAIWAQVLRVERVGLDGNFFALGGHSLLATQLISRVRDVFAVELPLRSLFDAPTVRLFLAQIQSARGAIQTPPRLPLGPRARDTDLPLSFAQERMWFGAQLEPGSSSYNIPLHVRVRGALDVAALTQSLNEIVRRHEILRTTFENRNGQPRQSVADTLLLTVPLIDLCGDLDEQPESAREEEMQRLAEAEARRPFDLANGPLLRVVLLRLGAHEHVVLFTVHHILLDGWSIGVLIEELKALYEGFVQGQPATLPPLPVQYGDFACWQRQLVRGEFLATQLAYWKQQLAGAPATLDLRRPRVARMDVPAELRKFVLPAQLVAALKGLCQREGVTPFMLLLAALQTLLYRYSGQQDIVVGSPIANRTRSETETLIGCFINPLALRTTFSSELSFREVLHSVRETTLGAFAHQDLPFEHLVKELQWERTPGRNPLFQVLFVFQNSPLPPLILPGLTLTPLEVKSLGSAFDLGLSMRETGEELTGYFEYRTDVFTGAAMDRLIDHFKTLLASITSAPDTSVTKIPLLTEPEQRQLLDWAQLAIADPPLSAVHELFADQVARTPGAVAVVCGREQLTYWELNRRSNQLAQYLRRLGVGPEVLVGIMLERSLDQVVGLLGILKAGGAYVPLDHAYPQERLKFIIADAGVRVLVTVQHLRARGPLLETAVICLDEDSAAIAMENTENLAIPTAERRLDNLAYVIYTSGSTGQPKGVLIQHDALANYCEAATGAYAIEPTDRVLQFASLSFDTSAEEIYPCLTRGATLVLRSDSMLDSVGGFLRECRELSISVLNLPTTYWHELTAVCAAEQLALPSSLRLVIIGGERAQPEKLATWQQQTDRRPLLVNTYGPTEATIVTTMTELQEAVSADREWSEVPIGAAVRNAQTYVVDAFLQPVPIGFAGELLIGGAGLARGYLNRPELTAEKFIPHPFSRTPGARLYQTGDLVRLLADGRMEFLGRTDEQVKVRGFRVEPAELEALLSTHPVVHACAVVARAATGGIRLFAFVVASPMKARTTSELYQFLRERLPAYMLPARLILLDAMPLTASGKVDRQALAASEQKPTLQRTFVAPRTLTEEVLAGIWAELLEVERVGVHDDFFELGGHSLLGMQLIARLRDAFHQEMALSTLFAAATVAGLAQQIERTNEVKSDSAAEATPAKDLAAEAVLDATIQPDGAGGPPTEPARLLLTGSTGFLGSFLLRELLQQTEAEIYCLIRADDEDECQRKLQRSLVNHQLWDDQLKRQWRSRIIPIRGDLSQPLLGLSPAQFQLLATEIDVIYHCGALVNHAYPYAGLKAANVLGTQEILRLASQIRLKPVHFVSTLSVFSTPDYAGLPFLEDDDLEHCAGLVGGYAQSKWVAEKLMMEARGRGLPICIYRPGRITGHSQTGVWNSEDLAYQLITNSIRLGSMPALRALVDMLPVDYVSKAIVHLSRQPGSAGKAFHLINPSPRPGSEIEEWIQQTGSPLRRIHYEDWRAELIGLAEANQAEPALASLLLLLPTAETKGGDDQERQQREGIRPLLVDCRNTLAGLSGSDIVCPPINDELLAVYFSSFRRRVLASNSASPEPSRLDWGH